MMLCQVPIPAQMPETAAQAIIWIAVACIAGLLTALGFLVRWFLGYVNDIREDTKTISGQFIKETEEARVAAHNRSEADREAHKSNLSSILRSHELQQDKQLASFDRHIERLSAAVEGKIRNERKSTDH